MPASKNFQYDPAIYSSPRAAGFAHAAHQRREAEARRQAAHDTAASDRAAEKRAERRHEIVSRPRGRTEAIGHHPDGRPIYRSIPAFRARPYTPPDQRKERPAPSKAHGVVAALKAEAPQLAPLHERITEENFSTGPYFALVKRIVKVDAQRAARKVRMAAKRRRGW